MAKQHKTTLSDIPPVDCFDIADRIKQYQDRIDAVENFRNEQADQIVIGKLGGVIQELKTRLKDYILTVKC